MEPEIILKQEAKRPAEVSINGKVVFRGGRVQAKLYASVVAGCHGVKWGCVKRDGRVVYV